MAKAACWAFTDAEVQNCGECGEIPCKLWFDTREPKFSDEEFKENIAMRVQTLKKE